MICEMEFRLVRVLWVPWSLTQCCFSLIVCRQVTNFSAMQRIPSSSHKKIHWQALYDRPKAAKYCELFADDLYKFLLLLLSQLKGVKNACHLKIMFYIYEKLTQLVGLNLSYLHHQKLVSTFGVPLSLYYCLKQKFITNSLLIQVSHVGNH